MSLEVRYRSCFRYSVLSKQKLASFRILLSLLESFSSFTAFSAVSPFLNHLESLGKRVKKKFPSIFSFVFLLRLENGEHLAAAGL